MRSNAARNKASIRNKIYRKLHWILFSKIKPGKWIKFFYASYRHRNRKQVPDADQRTVYITQIPNEGAGIGHQIANFNGGYHYSMLFGIPFAYPGFCNKEWEHFLGFGEHEVSIEELKKQGYRMRKLPYFNESEKSLALIRQIKYFQSNPMTASALTFPVQPSFLPPSQYPPAGYALPWKLCPSDRSGDHPFWQTLLQIFF